MKQDFFVYLWLSRNLLCRTNVCLLLKHFKPKRELKKKYKKPSWTFHQESLTYESHLVVFYVIVLWTITLNQDTDCMPYVVNKWMKCLFMIPGILASDRSLASFHMVACILFPCSYGEKYFDALANKGIFLGLLKVVYPPWEYRWTEKTMAWYLDLWGRIWPWLNWSSRATTWGRRVCFLFTVLVLCAHWSREATDSSTETQSLPFPTSSHLDGIIFSVRLVRVNTTFSRLV